MDPQNPNQEPAEPLGPPELPKGAKFTPLTSVQPKVQSAERPLFEHEDKLNDLVDHPGDPDGVVAAEKKQQWQAENPVPHMPELDNPKPKKRRKKLTWLWVLLSIILIGAAAYGAYWFGSNQADKKSAKKPAAQTQQQTASDQLASTSDKQTATVPTKHYDSTTYTLGFDHPQDWTVTDTVAKLVATSPVVSLKTSGGTTVNGHVVVTFQNQQTSIPGYPANDAVAVMASEKLTYTQPTQVQRAQTYLSYLSYGKANGLDALYITGDNGYQKDQNIPQTDVVKGNPLISVTFQSCTSADCSTGTPTMLTLVASDWASLASSKQVTNLLKSIQLN
jgi:cytoskeletal protein RodZ